MRGFVYFINGIPFCGKLPIRYLLLMCFQSETEILRRHNGLALLFVLATFIFGHTLQAVLGIEALGFKSPVWAKIIFGLFTTANLCVAVAQIYLAFRVKHFFFDRPFLQTRKTLSTYSFGESVKMLVITFFCHMIFCSTYNLFH